MRNKTAIWPPDIFWRLSTSFLRLRRKTDPTRTLIMKSATGESLVSSVSRTIPQAKAAHVIVLVHFKQIQFLLRLRVWQIVGDVMWIHDAALGSRQQELQVCVINLVITLSTGTVSPNVFWILWKCAGKHEEANEASLRLDPNAGWGIGIILATVPRVSPKSNL